MIRLLVSFAIALGLSGCTGDGGRSLTIKQKCERLEACSIANYSGTYGGTPWFTAAVVDTCTAYWYNAGWLGPRAATPPYCGKKAMECMYDHVAYAHANPEFASGTGKIYGKTLMYDCLNSTSAKDPR